MSDYDLDILEHVAERLYISSKNLLENKLGNLDLPKSRKNLLVKEAEELFKKDLKSMADEINAKYLARSCKDLEKVNLIYTMAHQLSMITRDLLDAYEEKWERHLIKEIRAQHDRVQNAMKETMQERSVSGRQIITGSYIPTGGK